MVCSLLCVSVCGRGRGLLMVIVANLIFEVVWRDNTFTTKLVLPHFVHILMRKRNAVCLRQKEPSHPLTSTVYRCFKHLYNVSSTKFPWRNIWYKNNSSEYSGKCKKNPWPLNKHGWSVSGEFWISRQPSCFELCVNINCPKNWIAHKQKCQCFDR